MNRLHPVFTVETECQDCYKCVRQCPVKAIRVTEGHARVVPELCIACGHCVQVCPAHAKQVRDDLGRMRHLLGSGRDVYFSIAPSWVSEFPDLTEAQLVGACLSLKVKGVSETALGAQQVTQAVARELAARERGLLISSACPAVVEFVAKYLPDYRDCLTPIVSPLLAHTQLLRGAFGEDIAVVFVGPCVAKKLEADRNPDQLQLALTFQDLRRCWKEEGIDPTAGCPDARAGFVPDRAEEGSLYPVAGGMVQTLRATNCKRDRNLLEVTGLQALDLALDGFNPATLNEPLFLEALACSGGCVGGPCLSQKRASLEGMLAVHRNVRLPDRPSLRSLPTRIAMAVPAARPQHAAWSDTELKEALARVGKHCPDDELNCGGCGYDTCRLFATALLAGNAEPAMCVSYMRQKAQRKANALLRCIPSGAVIADHELRIIECNRAFADMFGESTRLAFDTQPGMEGALLDRILPFADLFRAALRSGQDLVRDHLPADGRLLDIAIFTVEPNQTVGAIIQDVTQTELHREQIARRARKVIRRNLATVQEIACRLGEHMADTEILLSSIAEGYASERLTNLDIDEEDTHDDR